MAESLLDFLDIEFTERCNLSCRHCYIRRPIGSAKHESREISCGKWGLLLVEAKDLGCQGIRFTGGEPLIRDDFPLVYIAAHQLGYEISVSTNLTRLSDRIADV
ncbi:MAG: Radical domain protein [Candidatus Berkelbacteria bacterium]|nr:Radical domain protein [Candidatus Berkelbacteria bacterium]